MVESKKSELRRARRLALKRGSSPAFAAVLGMFEVFRFFAGERTTKKTVRRKSTALPKAATRTE
jgi:hypothetical protein